MRIEDHKLTGVPFEATENMGGPIVPTLLIVHYTVVRSTAAAIRAFRSKERQASAHLILDADGTWTQMVPFNRKAWHAGPSEWAGRAGCNDFAVGIEIVNPGPLDRQGTTFRDVNNLTWNGEVVRAKHRNGSQRWKYWAAYTQQQLTALEEVGTLLVANYQLKGVAGHDDVAPMRKIDPGPAFPMDRFRGILFGRAQDGPELYETTTELNIRNGPGVQFNPVQGSPLKKGTRVRVASQGDQWWHVMVADSLVEGWVHSRYLTEAQFPG